MAFPVVEATNTSTQAASTSHTVALPASIVAGELLIVIFGLNSNGIGVAFPAGWTIQNQLNNGFGNAMVVAWRLADGLEGASITVTSSTSVISTHNSYRISGAEDPTVQFPQVNITTSYDPPNLIATGGADDYLWLVALVPGIITESTEPTNYGTKLYASLTDASCHSARRVVNAASENPGTWSNTGSAEVLSATIAVYPVFVPAPPTPTHHNSIGLFFSLVDNGSTRDLSNQLTAVEGLPGTRELIDVTKVISSGRNFERSGWSSIFMLEGFYNTDSSGSVHLVLSRLCDLHTVTAFAYGPTGASSGASPINRKISGDCQIRTYDITGRVANAIAYRAVGQVAGVVNFGTWT